MRQIVLAGFLLIFIAFALFFLIGSFPDTRSDIEQVESPVVETVLPLPPPPELRIPDEYRILAKNLAGRLYDSRNAATLAYQIATEAVITERRKAIMELNKVSSDDPDITSVVEMVVPALLEVIERYETIQRLPDILDWGKLGEAVFKDAVDIWFGKVVPTETGREAFSTAIKYFGRNSAVGKELEGMRRATEKIASAIDLLPGIAQKYSPDTSRDASFGLGFDAGSDGVFFVNNSGVALKDCTFAVDVIGKNITVHSVLFAETLSADTTLVTMRAGAFNERRSKD